MKKLLFLLAFSFCFVAANAQGITASNGTVVVKQGTVSVTGGTISSITTGTFTSKGIDTLNQGLRILRGDILTSTVEITRPSNTTAYTALDAISSSSTAPTTFSFASITRSASYSGYITSAYLSTDQSTNTSRFKVHLFTGTVTAINDNAAFTHLYANNSTYIGSITFDACTTEGSGSTAASSINTTIRLPFKLTTGSSLYGLLETLDAFTPTSGQKIFIKINVDAN